MLNTIKTLNTQAPKCDKVLKLKIDSSLISLTSSRQVTYKGKTYTGYMSLVAALGRTLDLDVPLTSPDFYGKISEEKLNEYLIGDNGVPCPLLKDRLRCLHGTLKNLSITF